MVRLLVSPIENSAGNLELSGEYHHKIKSVLRMKPGEELEIVDGKGNIYQTKIELVEKEKTLLKILDHREIPKPSVPVTLIQAIAKGKRFDLVLQKATELGVSKIVPLITKRTISRPDGKESKKTERWREIVRHAVEQCGQAWMPEVCEPVIFESLNALLPKSEMRVLFYEEEKTKRLRDIWPKNSPKEVQILIGPEGGFETSEIELASSMNFQSVSLGALILRSDTAPLVALSLVQFLAGELG